jgi:uncharacterized protein (DUF1778 family)
MRKRDAYIHIRVTQREMQTIDALARQLRRTRSDLMRVLALEKAEELGVTAGTPPGAGQTNRDKQRRR